MKKVVVLIACFCMIGLFAGAQYSRFIISFKNKNGSPFTIASPSRFLSGQSVARRLRQNIITDSTDLPITPAYIDSLLSVPGIRIINKSKWLNQVCISTTSPDALSRINAFSFVQGSSPVALRIRPSENPVPVPEFPVQSVAGNRLRKVEANVLDYGNSMDQVHLHNGEYLHNQGFTGEGITLAIMDAGFFGYRTNPMFDSVRLQGRVLGEWDFVASEQSVNEDDTHGMYCFSIMAANKPGAMIGGAPKARYYLFRTEDANSEYPVEEQNWAAAAELADSLGVDMISSSLGYTDFDDPSFNHSYLQRNGNTSIVTRAADLAAKKGIIVMNSAGNEGADANDTKYVACPADGDSVIAVGAVDSRGTIAGFSSWGPNGAGKRKPNIVSLGVATTIAGTNGNPSSGNGTSFSNPNIAALIACLWQAFPEFNNMSITDAVEKSSSRYNNPDDRYGYGIPDLKKAFAILVAKKFQGSLTNEGCKAIFTWSGKDDKTMRYEIEKRAGTDTGFTRIASINGKTSLFSMNSYSFTDSLKSVSPVNVRYRLKQVLPGDTMVVLMDSSIAVASSCFSGNAIIVAPNPVKNNIAIWLNSTEGIRNASIGLYNHLGQLLYKYEGSIPAGLFTHNIPAGRLPAGFYIVTVRDKRSIIFSEKIMK